MIWRATIAVLVLSVAGCSSDSDGSAPSGGSGAAAGMAGANPGGAATSGGSGQGGNAMGVGGGTSAGGSVTGGGRSSTGGGGTSVGGAILSGGQTGAGGGSSGAGGGSSGAGGGSSGAGGGSSGAGGGSVGGCPGVGASCDPTTTFCCTGLVCVTSTSPDYAGCREECTTAADCASGCCIPFANIPNKGFCGSALQCQCAGEGETCGGTRQCCGGFSCSTFDATGALACHKLCAQNSDCSTNCCVEVQGTSDKVCLPAKPFCGQ